MLRHGQGEEDNGLGAQKGQHLGQGLGKVAALGGLEDRVQVGKLLGVGRYPALCTRRKRIAQPVHQPNIANIKDPTGVKAGRRLKCYGHDITVSATHYLAVIEEMYQKAAGIEPKAGDAAPERDQESAPKTAQK